MKRQVIVAAMLGILAVVGTTWATASLSEYDGSAAVLDDDYAAPLSESGTGADGGSSCLPEPASLGLLALGGFVRALRQALGWSHD